MTKIVLIALFSLTMGTLALAASAMPSPEASQVTLTADLA